MKKCACCKQIKEFVEFNKQSLTKDGLRTHCRQCQKDKQAVYRAKNRELINFRERTSARAKAYDKLRSIRDRLKIKDRMHKYYQKNKKLINKKVTEKRKKDPIFKLKGNLRTRLRSAILKEQKTGSAVRDLGCSIEFFKNYLESKFIGTMNWENYGRGGWHIDHIIPLSAFDLSIREEFLKACHYTNLQPLWEFDNISKSNKIPKGTSLERTT